MEDQVEQHRKWWQQIKQHRVAIVAVAIVFVVVIVLITIGYWFDWTDFNGYNKITVAHTISGTNAGTVTKTEEYQPGKTLWDWLQLLGVLALPGAVGFGVAWYSSRQNHDREIAREQHENDLRIAEDNQREAALQSYIDKMSELLLHEKLRESQPKGEVQNIARVRTLTLLPKLEPLRKRTVIRFLYESGLVSKGKPIVDLSSANLVSADLHGAILRDVDMHEIDFRDAILSRANLSGSDLRKTNLRRANLDGAELSGANLKDAIGVNIEELEKKAKSLKGATMPNGSIHP